MIKGQEFKNFQYNILGSESSLTGDLKLSGDTILNSHIEGDIEVTGDGKLVLERESLVKGKIKGTDLEIFGHVEGEIHCTGIVAIRSSARVHGNIVSGRLVIYPGAEVELNAHAGE